MLEIFEKDKPTLIFDLIFCKLKIFLWLNEINVHFEYFDVSLISFCRFFF